MKSIEINSANTFDKIIIRKNQDGKQAFEMDGASVYAFTIMEIPKIIAKYLKMQKKNIKELKKNFFHQASGIILDTLDRKINNTVKKGTSMEPYFNLKIAFYLGRHFWSH